MDVKRPSLYNILCVKNKKGVRVLCTVKTGFTPNNYDTERKILLSQRKSLMC